MKSRSSKVSSSPIILLLSTRSWISIWFLFSLLLLVSPPGIWASGEHPWCYKEEKCAPMTWSGICKTGNAQSPIDFNVVSHSRHLQKIRTSKAYKHGHSQFYVKNNGHTVQIQLREDLTSNLRIDSDGFRQTRYQFSQAHLHWGSHDKVGSEHTINGTSYPMELHLVHFSEQYSNLLQAITDKNSRSLAVFGIFFEISQEDNKALAPIMESLAIVDTYQPDATLFTSHIPLNFSAFFPEVMDVFRYEGSLTTPSCGEKVVWTVFRNPLSISAKQIEAFRQIKDTFGDALVDNFRPVKPLGRRKVYESRVFMADIPEKEAEPGQELRSRETSKENDIPDSGESKSSTPRDSGSDSGEQRSSSTRTYSYLNLLIAVTIVFPYLKN